jgi:carboxyl-terminal processing protease
MPRARWLWLWVLLVCGSTSVAGRAADAPAKEPQPAAKKVEAKAKPVRELDDYELQRLLVDTIDQVQRNYVREIPRRRIVEAAIKGILAELDPYSSYISPEEIDRFRSMVESEFGGIGVQVEIDRHEGLKVVSPMVGTPAYRAGLIAGDRIVEIDGKPTQGITMDEAMQRIKGPEGSQIAIKVIHPGKTTPEEVKVKRQAIHVETVLGDHRKHDDTWDYLIDSAKRIAYIRVTSFSRDTASDLRKVLAELQKEKIRGLVLDLRFNPGGLLTSAVEVSDLFIADGRIVSTAGRNSPERVWNAHKEGTFEGFRMAILVNRYSASASEIVSACLQDHKRAVVVGERTWGKGSVQNVISLDDYGDEPAGAKNAARHESRSALKLTTAGYRRPSGKNIDRAPDAKETDEWGVRPDSGLEVRLTDEELYTMMTDRRSRDIVQPKHPGEKPKPEKPAPQKPQPKPEPKVPGADRQLQTALDFLTAELARAQ